MKRFLWLVLLSMPCCAFAQTPAWVGETNHFPRERYLVGYAENEGRETPQFVNALKTAAKQELIESIRVSVTSLKEMYKSESAGGYSEDFVSTSSSFANAEINGMAVEYYYSDGVGYAIAYADKNEVKGYYKANISFTIQKIEAAIETAGRFEEEGQKGRAKKMYEDLAPLFGELEFAQSLLIAIEGGEPAGAQIAKTMQLQQIITQAIARMQTAIIVYVTSRETNLGRPVKILAQRLKSELSKHGCSFTEAKSGSDWFLTIDAATREGNNVDGICFAYLDVTVSLVESRTGKEIYSNHFSGLKGGALTYDQAGLKAYNSALTKIVEELVKKL